MRYNVLTGLVHCYCRPYRTNSYFKAIIALIYRRIVYGRGYIIKSSYIPTRDIPKSDLGKAFDKLKENL